MDLKKKKKLWFDEEHRKISSPKLNVLWTIDNMFFYGIEIEIVTYKKSMNKNKDLDEKWKKIKTKKK